MRHLFVFAVISLAAGWASAQVPVNNFWGGNGVVGYSPVVDTVTSGVQMVVQPTVSADRKYVTLSMQPQLSQLIKLQNYSVVQGMPGVGTGVPGGVVPAINAPAVANPNISAPVSIQRGSGGRMLHQGGMTRVE